MDVNSEHTQPSFFFVPQHSTTRRLFINRMLAAAGNGDLGNWDKTQKKEEREQETGLLCTCNCKKEK